MARLSKAAPPARVAPDRAPRTFRATQAQAQHATVHTPPPKPAMRAPPHDHSGTSRHSPTVAARAARWALEIALWRASRASLHQKSRRRRGRHSQREGHGRRCEQQKVECSAFLCLKIAFGAMAERQRSTHAPRARASSAASRRVLLVHVTWRDATRCVSTHLWCVPFYFLVVLVQASRRASGASEILAWVHHVLQPQGTAVDFRAPAPARGRF